MNRHGFDVFDFAESYRPEERVRHHGGRHSHRHDREHDPRGEFTRLIAALCHDSEQGFRGHEQRGSGRPSCGGRFEGRGGHGSERGWGRHGHGRFGGPGGFEGESGRGRGRMFDSGDFKLVVLKLLSEQPSYGYQLIKTMEQRLAGGYTPSAGVIYPTLTLLEEEGFAVASVENNKKVYSVTAEGTQFLKANQQQVDLLFSRLDEAGRNFERERHPELMHAFKNLRGAVVARVSRGRLTKEQIAKIADAINTAAKTIDEF